MFELSGLHWGLLLVRLVGIGAWKGGSLLNTDAADVCVEIETLHQLHLQKRAEQ